MSFGLRKGFLLSDKSLKKKGLATESYSKLQTCSEQPKSIEFTSSHSAELLDFERHEESVGPKVPQSLIVSTSTNQETLTSPSQLMHKSINSKDSMDGTDDNFGIRELQTFKLQHSSLDSSFEKPLRPTLEQSIGEHSLAQNGYNGLHRLPVNPDSDEQTERLIPDVWNSDSLRGLSRELSKHLFRHSSKCQHENFVSTFLTSRDAWLFTWPQVLKNVHRREAARELGSQMLMKGLDTLVQLIQNQRPQCKTSLLGAILLSSHVVRTNQMEKILASDTDHLDADKGQLKISSHQLLEVLQAEWVEIVVESQSRRTVLAQEALISAYGLASCGVYKISSFKALLEAHEQWLSQNIGTSRDSWRRRCTLAVVQDWIKILKENPCGLDGRKHESTGELILVGQYNIEFGGLRHTLFSKHCTDVDRTLEILADARQCSQAIRRSIFRGVLAILGQDKAFWFSDFIEGAITRLVPLLLEEDETGTNKLCSELLIFLLQAAPIEQLNSNVAMIVESLSDHPSKAQRIGSPWRHSLLENAMVPDDRFAQVLESVCIVMFAEAKEVAPLALFGTLVDGNVEAQHRVHQAFFSVVKVCSHQLNATWNVGDVYQRLAPLLLIRRIPSSFFTSVSSQEKSLSADQQQTIAMLVGQMSRLLFNKLSTSVSTSERKLAAEIVGRCLPFNNNSSYSSFDLILMPAFRNLSSCLRLEADEPSTDAYRPAKIALYAACCHVPLAGKQASLGILDVANFALWLLSADHPSQTDALLDCQVGCLQFFTACLKADIMPISLCLHQIVTGQAGCFDWIDGSTFGEELSEKDLDSLNLKVFIWGAYQLATEHTTDESWATKTGPWVLQWLCENVASSGPAAVTISSALQILTELVRRDPSLSSFPTHDVSKLFRCIQASLLHESREVQVSALEFLKSLMDKLKNGSRDDRCQGMVQGAELMEALKSIVRMAHKSDIAELRHLAMRLLQL